MSHLPQSKGKTTTKKPAAAKTAAGKSTAAKNTASKSGSKKKSASKNRSKPIVRREVWAGLYLLGAFVGLLSAFGVEGFLIDWYDTVFLSVLGYGCALLPFALLFCGVLLILKRKGKARLRVTCMMLVPVFFGALRHMLACQNTYAGGLKGMSALAADGIAGVSGGVIAGGVGILLRAAVGLVGGCILVCLLALVCLFGALHLTPARLWRSVQALQPQPEPEEEEDPYAELPILRPVREQKPAAQRRGVDIAVEDDNSVSRRRPVKESGSLVAPPNVPTPAEVLRGSDQADKEARRAAAEAEAKQREAESKQKSGKFADAVHNLLGQKKEEPKQELPSAAVEEPPFDFDEPVVDIAMEPVRQPKAVAPVTRVHAPKAEPVPVEEEAEPVSEADVAQEIQDNLKDTGDHPVYFYPPIHLLHPGSGRLPGSAEAVQNTAERLIDTLSSFGIEAKVVDITSGPAVTRYEILLQRGTKVARVTNLSDDIALALGASGIRVSTIPDKNAVGVEVPNEQQELVTVRDIVDTAAFRNSKSRLSFAVGKNIAGEPLVGDIGKMPHMLIAGTTGSGKSVCINGILISLLYKSTPEEVRLIMVDPKMIELGVYNGIPHLLLPVVTDPKKAAGALNWAVGEMMRRYKKFADVGARDLNGYNAEMERRAAAAAEQPVEEGAEPPKFEKLPRIVVVVDELSDLMAVARREVEEAIIRIAQMARAAGMHLIIATQRPSADVITGLMKTNIPSRIAFAVASAIDSRIILDQMGAEKLLGKGDMLYAPLGGGKPKRVQGCFVTDQEVEAVVSFVKERGTADYDQEVMDFIERQAEPEATEGGVAGGGGGGDEEEDPLLMDAIEVVVEMGQASVSMLQRRLKLGYSRAARLVDQMEERGIVGPFEGSKPRSVTITREEWQEMQLRRENL